MPQAGPGEPGLSLAAQHKDSTVTVTDYSQGMVEVARQRGEKMGLRNTRHVCSLSPRRLHA